MSVDRRNFLKVAAGSAAALASSVSAAEPAAAAPQNGGTMPDVDVLTTDREAGDVTFSVGRSQVLNIEYAAAVPGSSFRGLHESLNQLRESVERTPNGLPSLSRRDLGGHGTRLRQD